MSTRRLAGFAAILIGAAFLNFGAQGQTQARQAAKIGPSEFMIGGAVATPLTISEADLRKMPRITVQVMNSHAQKQETYEGVSLAALLKQAGLPQGEQLRGASMTLCVVAEAADGYRVAYSLAELDPSIGDSGAIVADTMDGAPLGAGEGVFKLVAPHDRRPARWVRMLSALTVVQLPKS